MITVVGSFVVDLTARCPHLPVPGETVPGGPFRTGAGGKGSNQAVAAARLGADVSMVTRLGTDSFAQIAYQCWDEAGIDYSCTTVSGTEATGVALIAVDENTGQNQILVASGACMEMTAEDVLPAEEKIADSEVLMLQLEIHPDANRKAIELAAAHGTKILFNPAPFSSVPVDLLPLVGYVTPNETEASAWTGIPVTDRASALEAARRILSMGPRTAIITLGSEGCLVCEADGRWFVQEAFPVQAVDTTGAGDAFSGGLAFAIDTGMDLREAVRFASAVAALSVTRAGTAVSMPRMEEVTAFLSAADAS